MTGSLHTHVSCNMRLTTPFAEKGLARSAFVREVYTKH